MSGSMISGGENRLTGVTISDKLSDMKKVTARQFQKEFGRIAEGMREGQTLEITMHGKPVGQFTKRTKKFKFPDFVTLLEREGCSVETGNQILKEFHDSLS